ncbi:MAG TPA: Ig-like domain-containing protein, partial [Chitinispirillaceae bacterium]|nr:Ig-like domain-containing protein [Chitinispirillaceae bacterium]
PVCAIVTPVNNATFTAPSTITITAEASDPDGTVAKVSFFADGALLGEDDASPYSYDWTTAPVGAHTLTAVATDNASATQTSSAISITVVVPNQLPVCSITSPANSATFTAPSTITITADASDPDGTVAKVSFFADSVLLGEDDASPYSYDWTTATVGAHSLTAVATDNSSATKTSSSIEIILQNPPAPTLLYPQNSEKNIAINSLLKWYSHSVCKQFQIQIAEDTSLAKIIVDTIVKDTVSDLFNQKLCNNTTYFWHVRIKDSMYTSCWSENWNFTTKLSLPGLVMGMTPSPESVFMVDTMTFFWQRMLLCDRYSIKIAYDSTMETVVKEDSSVADTMYIQRGFQNNTSFWWSVKAHNESGWGTFSTPQKFSIKIPTTSAANVNYFQITNGVSNCGYRMKYGLAEPSNVSLRIFTLQGKLIRTVVHAYQKSGNYSVAIPAALLSKGSYIVCFKTAYVSLRQVIFLSM